MTEMVTLARVDLRVIIDTAFRAGQDCQRQVDAEIIRQLGRQGGMYHAIDPELTASEIEKGDD